MTRGLTLGRGSIVTNVFIAGGGFLCGYDPVIRDIGVF